MICELYFSKGLLKKWRNSQPKQVAGLLKHPWGLTQDCQHECYQGLISPHPHPEGRIILKFPQNSDLHPLGKEEGRGGRTMISSLLTQKPILSRTSIKNNKILISTCCPSGSSNICIINMRSSTWLWSWNSFKMNNTYFKKFYVLFLLILLSVKHFILISDLFLPFLHVDHCTINFWNTSYYI